MERPNAWKAYDENTLKDLEAVSTRYRAFLDNGKTERECVKQAVEMAKAHGYTDLADAVKAGRRLNPGDKLYSVCMDNGSPALKAKSDMVCPAVEEDGLYQAFEKLGLI